MSKRKYTKMDKYAAQIAGMHDEGRSRQEIADALGLENDQEANWIERNNRKERNPAKGIPSKPKGRPRKQSEIEQLCIEISCCGIFCNSQKGCEAEYDEKGEKGEKGVAAELQLHSDQGFQYTSQAYFKLAQSYGITPSIGSFCSARTTCGSPFRGVAVFLGLLLRTE